ALEGHVLQQMGDALLGGGLVARTDAHPDAHRHGLQVRHAVGDDAHAVRQPGLVDHLVDSHAAAPFRPSARSATKRWMAARSLGSTAILSGSVSSGASRGGSAGRAPVMASMTSGNLAGCAVASTTRGVASCGRAIRAFPAATTPQAVCGSRR